ncbi:MAG TPA: AmmeMemoRadiSam system radical SAM enzyme [Bacteroidales bacterium]|nr:AmmeMemoRadiSam system radical SAM enzyme [Bacteroidales bacterium]
MRVIAKYQKKLDGQQVECLLCPHFCELKAGQTGICRTRENIGGMLYSNAYGNPCSVAVDPIEKKPLFHFLPGSRILSIATAGCNLRCQNCQNWSISQVSPSEVPAYELSPEAIIELALKEGTKSIAFTYTEPTVFFEYMLDTAKLAKKANLKTVLISNGYINPEPLKELCEYLDAANIDLKVFDEALHKKLTGAKLQPVLETLLTLKSEYVWLEITNLLIPGFSDDPQLIRELCDWLVINGFSDTPLHFSRFFPNYKLPHTQPTPPEDLQQAYDTAKNAGIRFVYTGNLPGVSGENTTCPSCRKTLIGRVGYRILSHAMDGNCCQYCGTVIPGIFR